MSQLGTETVSGRRTIGDILLGHGYVTPDQLEQAAETQQRTGKPLGQVLVESGAITRLELASALAEQWSDTSTDWLGQQREADAPGSLSSLLGPPGVGDGVSLGVLQRAQDEGLAARMTTVEAALNDLEGRLQGTSAAALEDALLELGQRVNGLEPLVNDLAAHAAAAPARSEHDTRLEALSMGVQSLELYVERLGGVLDEVAARPSGDAGIAARVEELANRIETLPDTTAVEELRAAAEELALRPAGDPQLVVRLDVLAERVDALGAALDEVAERPIEDLFLSDRVEGLAARIETLADTTAVEELRAAAAELAARPAGDPQLAARLDVLAERVDALAADSERREDTWELDELRVAVDALSARPVRDAELATRVDELAAAVAHLPSQGSLEELRSAIAELAERPAGDQLLAERVEALTARMATLADAAALEELHRRTEELASRLASDPDLEEHLGSLTARLEQLELEAAILRDSPPTVVEVAGNASDLQAALYARIEELRGQTEEASQQATQALESVAAAQVALDGRIAELAARIDERPGVDGAPAPPPPPASNGAQAPVPGLEKEIERLLGAVERLGLHLGQHDRALAELMRSRGKDARLDELAARLDDLETLGVAAPSADGSAPAAGSGDARELRAEVRALTRKVEEADEARRAEREKLLVQLERMASSIDWRFQRIEARTAEAPSADS